MEIRPTLTDLLTSETRTSAHAVLAASSPQAIRNAKDWGYLTSLLAGGIIGGAVGVSGAYPFWALALVTLGLVVTLAAQPSLSRSTRMQAHRTSALATLTELDKEARTQAALSAQEHYALGGIPADLIPLAAGAKVELTAIKDGRPFPALAYFPSDSSPLVLMEVIEVSTP